jgi:leader peptidase (prepilin peptidase)/N-methyltransferase
MCQVANWFVLILLAVASVIDWRKREIPMSLLFIMSAGVTIFAIYCKDITIWYRLAGGALGIMLFVVSTVTKEAIGYGDSWLILLLGVQLGILRVLQLLFAASLLAVIFAVFYLWVRKWNRKATLPFVPFLTIAYLGVMFG